MSYDHKEGDIFFIAAFPLYEEEAESSDEPIVYAYVYNGEFYSTSNETVWHSYVVLPQESA